MREFATSEQVERLINLGFEFKSDCVWYGNFLAHHSQLSDVDMSECIPAPTLEQVNAVMRKKKGLHIMPKLIGNNTWTYDIIDIHTSIPISLNKCICYSYEDAMIVALGNLIRHLETWKL